jgi:prepilin-type processing-associated H-X9-DG protein
MRLETLDGGQHIAWRAGDVVFKPLDISLDALRWQAEILSSVVPDGFRVAVPLATREGDLVVERWTAWSALAGRPAARRSIAAPEQLIHGDLSGNVLFADGLPLAVINMSAYWRPAAYASAIVAVDAVLWHGADVELLAAVAAPSSSYGRSCFGSASVIPPPPPPSATARQWSSSAACQRLNEQGSARTERPA